MSARRDGRPVRVAATLLGALRSPASLRTLELPEWEVLLSCARRNAVLAYLGERSTAAGEIDAFPPQAQKAMRAAMTAVGRLAQLARWELERVRRVLAPAGIPVIALKGGAYLLRGLPHARTRPMSDVDVMVPHAAIDAAEQALLEAGWQGTKVDAYDQAYYRRWSHEIPPLQFPGRLLSVDVHHTICPPVSRLRPDPERFWANSQPSAMDGVRLLSPPDSVLHAAVHLFFDSDFDGRFRDLVDVHEMLEAFGREAGFWPALVESARLQGLARPLYYACVTRRTVLGAATPDDVLRELERYRPAAPVDAWMKRTLATLLTPADPADWPPAHRGLLWLMYARSHWLRMPPHLLVPHLVRKSFRRWRSPSG